MRHAPASATNRFMVVAFTEHQDTRRVYGDDAWPQHMTVLPWMNGWRLHATNRVRVAVSNIAPVQTRVAGTAEFGRAGEVNVWTLEQSASVMGLHRAVLGAALQNGTQLEDATFVGHAYSPHIAQKQGQPHHEIGEELVFSEISIIGKDETLGKMVLATIALPGRA